MYESVIASVYTHTYILKISQRCEARLIFIGAYVSVFAFVQQYFHFLLAVLFLKINGHTQSHKRVSNLIFSATKFKFSNVCANYRMQRFVQCCKVP